MADLEARLAELESRIAFQDDSLQALSDVVAAQNIELDKLRRELSRQAERLKALALAVDDNAASPTAEERPPHY